MHHKFCFTYSKIVLPTYIPTYIHMPAGVLASHRALTHPTPRSPYPFLISSHTSSRVARGHADPLRRVVISFLLR